MMKPRVELKRVESEIVGDEINNMDGCLLAGMALNQSRCLKLYGSQMTTYHLATFLY